jgi:hypothetical protein
MLQLALFINNDPNTLFLAGNVVYITYTVLLALSDSTTHAMQTAHDLTVNLCA